MTDIKFRESDFLNVTLTRSECEVLIGLIRSQQILLRMIPECQSVIDKLSK